MGNAGHIAKGRAAGTNAAGRFERFDVDYDAEALFDPDAPVLRTEVSFERPRSAITRNTSPDIPFDRSLNPYRGCEHGCIYCFARPSHAYLGLSPGLDFETKLIARPGIADVLDRELRRPRYKPAPLAIGTNTDPYQPIEKEHQIMRQVLEVLAAFRHPVGIVTKGSLILRDVDLLGELAADGLTHVGISVTTLDAGLARKMEPRCPGPTHRLRMIEALAKAGVPVRVMASPLVPGLSDHELEAILEAGRDAGAVAASVIPLRLPGEVSELWQDWLKTHAPNRVEKVMSKLRDMHGGRDYDPAWGKRMTGEGIWADLLQRRLARARTALGLNADLPRLRSDLFEPPFAKGDQLGLF